MKKKKVRDSSTLFKDQAVAVRPSVLLSPFHPVFRRNVRIDVYIESGIERISRNYSLRLDPRGDTPRLSLWSVVASPLFSCPLSYPAENQGKVPLCPLCDVASWKIGRPIFRGIGLSLKETARQKGNTRGSLACRVSPAPPPFAIWVIMLSSSNRRTSTGVESNRLP